MCTLGCSRLVCVPGSWPDAAESLLVTHECVIDAVTGVWGPGWLQSSSSMIRGLELSSLPSPSWEGDGAGGSSELMHHADVIEPPPEKPQTPKRRDVGSF